MKLSFQTFCLIFVVTILHLVVITVFAPLTKSATEYFANLDVETLLENGREDIAAIQDREERQKEESIVEAPEAEPEGTGIAGEQVAAVLLRAEGDRVAQNEDGRAEAAGNGAALADSARGAVVDIRTLAERVERPEIRQPVDRSYAGNTPSPELRGEPVTTGGEERVGPDPEAPAPPAPRVPRLQVREIRPL